MKILVACQNMNAYGGSELYHYELLMGLSEDKTLDITFATYTFPDMNFHLYDDLIAKGIKIKSISDIRENIYFENPDLVVVSQPHPTELMCYLFPEVPKISIIHSALRSEDAIKHPSIKHYIAVQPDIYQCLKNQYGINPKNISLIYNPIDETRFKKYTIRRFSKKVREDGVLIGEINDPLRRPMIEHAVQNCIQNNQNLTIISRSKFDFKHSNMQIIDPCYNTEDYVKYADFTVGIGGRTTIEGWMCGIPSYIYKVDPQGRILDIQLKYPPKTRRFERKFVYSQHIKLYNKIYEQSNNR